MPILTVRAEGGQAQEISFEGTPLLSEVLLAHGLAYAHPCGGRGSCGKCAVHLSGEVSPPSAAEVHAGTRLACQARLQGNCEALLPALRQMSQIEVGEGASVAAFQPAAGLFGAAVDIGTTTLALQIYELATGRVVSSAAEQNPQTAIAADVMGRIGAAMNGELGALCDMLLHTLEKLLRRACKQCGAAWEELSMLVITGNTTMLYLLMGQNPQALSHAPFDAERLFGEQALLFGKPAYLPRCMSAFVGADIACSVLASGMCEQGQTALLVDVGTNGEIALWHENKLYVSSTAAGPAFEGSGIHMGCGSIAGAIDRVWLEKGEICIHTIGEAPPVGLCGSGLIDAVAAFLRQEAVDETGATEQQKLCLTPQVYLIPEDIRNVQLAKAAISAGICTLAQEVHVPLEKVERLYIAGGFGSHLNMESALAIGLFPMELRGRERVIGNAALYGAGMLLLSTPLMARADDIAKQAMTVPLGGSSRFAMHYMEQMCFPEAE
ncbi:MAG: ASKHA domain-containing protein [Clostridia bacterium]